MSKPTLKLDWCSHEAAKYACEKWHYSRTIPVSKSAKLGVWENDRYVGLVMFALGASANLGSPYGLNGQQCCELVRVALDERHVTPVSRVVAIAIRLFAKQSSGVRLIVSFADTLHGHHGGIYQAGNWLYAGKSASGQMVRLADGRLVDPRRYNGHGNRNAKWGKQPLRSLPSGATLIKTPGKYRYLMPLDDEMRKRIEPLRKPYPKRLRAGGVAGDTSANHAGEGGSIPTPALSTCEKVE